jgi:1-acyl-sn-glycerol-3-phosphate acyltransferase
LTATADAAGRLGAIGWLRAGIKLAAMVVWLGLCLALYYTWKLFPTANPWPRRFLRGLGWLAGARVRRVGEPMRRGAVLLANHQSWLDILVLAGASGTAFVAHAGLAENVLLKWLCEMNDTVFVARTERGSVAGQVAQVREALSETGALAIFPEGTTTDGSRLLPFKSALLSALDPPPPGIAVQPVWLDYGREAAEIAWVGDEHGVANFLRVLARRHPFTVTAHFLAPFDPAAAGDRKAIAREARERIAQRMRTGYPIGT